MSRKTTLEFADAELIGLFVLADEGTVGAFSSKTIQRALFGDAETAEAAREAFHRLRDAITSELAALDAARAKG